MAPRARSDFHMDAPASKKEIIAYVQEKSRKLDRLKAEGHPLLSEWDTGRVSARAIS